MAVDKLVDSTQLDADLTSVANAIRTKGGTSAALAFPADFVSAIAAIPSGGGGTKAEGTITGSGTNTISINCPFKPDAILIIRSDYQSIIAVSDRAACHSLIWPSYAYSSTWNAASSTTVGNSGNGIGGGYVQAPPTASNSVAYENGVLYVKSGNNANLWSASLSYAYKLVKL